MADSPSLPGQQRQNPDSHNPDSPGLDDRDLVKQLQNGQDQACQACRTLVARYQERLLRIAWGITMDREEAAEIVQDVFVRAIANISQFRQEAGLGRWLGRITVNACLNWKRKWKRRFRWHHIPIDPDSDYLLYDTAKTGATPESDLLEKQARARVARAVAELPEKIRVVFVLKTCENLSYDEIARAVGIRPGTVSSRLHRARAMIREALEKKEASIP